MTIVVDTSVLIDHLRAHEQARAALRYATSEGERLAASVLTKVEVLAGMRPSEERPTRLLFESLDWIEVSNEIAEHAGALANRFLPSHPGVDPVDYVIAATAEQLNAELWTRNVKHFPMFRGLVSPY